MKLKFDIDANDTNGDLGQRLKENLELQGFKNVLVSQHPDDECLSVQGRIGERGKVTIRVDGKEERREIILFDIYRQSKLIWSRLNVNDFPEIISFAKLLNSFPLENISLTETTPKLVVEDAVELIQTSTPDSLVLAKKSPSEPASLSDSNEAHKPKLTKSDRLDRKTTLGLSLLAIMIFGLFFYLVREITISHQEIKNLKEQLNNKR